MLSSYSKRVKISVLILGLIAVFSIVWGIFDHRFLGGMLAYVLAGDIFLILLFLCSKFLLRSPTSKPIFKGFVWGLVISAALVVLILIVSAALDYQHREAGGSDDMAGLSGLFLFILWVVISIITLLISLLIGTVISYRNSKNPWVLTFLILLIMATITAVVTTLLFVLRPSLSSILAPYF